jgi:hypothetical protein
MKAQNMIGGLIVLALVGGGIAFALSSGKPKIREDRHVQVYEGDSGIWTFAILQNNTTIYVDPGPYATQEAAQIAGDSWLAANPVV